MNIFKRSVSLIAAGLLIGAPAANMTGFPGGGIIAAQAIQAEMPVETDYSCLDTVLEDLQINGGYSLMAKGDYILAVTESFSTPSMDIISIRATDGEVLGKLSFDSYVHAAQLDGGDFLVSAKNDTVTIYSPESEEKQTITAPESFLLCALNGSFMLYSDDRNVVKLYDTESGTEIKLTQELTSYSFRAFEDGFLVKSDMKYYKVAPDGNVKKLCGNSIYYPMNVSVDNFYDTAYEIVNYETDEMLRIESSDPTEYVMNAENGAFVSAVDGGVVVYDIANRRKKKIDCEGYLQAIFSDSTNVILYTRDENGVDIYHIDITEMEDTEEITIITDGDMLDFMKGYFIAPEDDEYVPLAWLDELHEKYNVDIYFEASEKFKESISTQFVIENDPDPETRVRQVKALEHYLEMLPDGLLNEATDGKDLFILFTEDIYSPDYTQGYGGFYDPSSTYDVIVLGLSCDLDDTTIPHEFMHLFTNKFGQEQINRWKELSPEDAYGELTDKYTPGDDLSDTENVYFTRSYGRTNYSEDMSTVSEVLYLSYYEGSMSYILEYPNVRKKAELLDTLLRETYTCLNDSNNIYWEDVLNGDLPDPPVYDEPVDEPVDDPDEPEYFATFEELCEMAINDYEKKVGIRPASASYSRYEDTGVLVIVLDDEEGNTYAVYNIDPYSGIGLSDRGEGINLPETGENSPFTAAAGFSASGMMIIGAAFCVSSRKKEN